MILKRFFFMAGKIVSVHVQFDSIGMILNFGKFGSEKNRRG